MNTPHSILKKYWGYDAFRPMQESIILSVLNGKDTLALLPTGGGKSLCFQVPTLVMDGMCLVISPLIALMKDQVMQLEKRNIPAQSVNAGMNYYETKDVLENACDGKYKFLYVSPERLNSKIFLEYLSDMDINLIAVDEAHCISQWGYDFRPAYLQIKKIRELLPKVPVIALTASATPDVQDDILLQLKMKDAACFRQSFERPNLAYQVVQPSSKHTWLLETIKNTSGSGIVYCKSRKQTKVVADLLISNGISADFYHAGLPTETRTRKQDEWINGATRIIASTNAFGMGIDKPDVRFVIHFDVPDCLENYYQEAGRAGRDLKPSTAILLTTPGDADALRKQIDLRFPEFDKIKSIYLSLMDHLQIAAGLGEGTLKPLDIGYFSEHFKLNVLDVNYVLQALEKDGILSFNESTWQPSTVQFQYATTDLRGLDTGNIFLNDLYKSLLRMYEGILDHAVMISEMAIAKFMSREVSDIHNGLQQLHKRGILHYVPKSDEPSVYLMLNRMYADDFRFNIQAHLARKKVYQLRVESMINYLTQSNRCRSSVIGNYFGDEHIKQCNICDICKTNNIKKSSVVEIAKEIHQMLKEKPVTNLMLEGKFGEKEVREVLQLLDAEGKIRINNQGELEGL